MPLIPDDAPIILTASGLHVSPLSLTPDQVRAEDVCHHLGNLCRFTGATREFYSVGQHSVILSHLVELEQPHLRKAAFLHDAAEFVLNDMCRPLKHNAWFGSKMRDVEDAAQRIVYAVFDIPWPEHPMIREFDKRLLADEAAALLPPQAIADWEILRGVEPFGIPIEPLEPREARALTLARWLEVKDD